MNDLQARGRAHYKHGEYKKAIELFDRAIGRTPSIQLLDNRAACFEKLNELSSALADAKKAIQLHREDATGYLRAGKVLVKMEKQSVALEIYTHGLKSIKHVGQGYELLRKVHKELMDQLSPPTSVDPLTMLPRELAEIILEHLSFRQRMNACLVSKQWSQFIKSCPSLWQHLDLSVVKKKVRTSFISTAINIARGKLSAATLNNLYDFDKTLTALIKHCPLEELTLLDTGLQSEQFTKTLAEAKKLKHLKLGEGTLLSPTAFQDLLMAVMDRLESFECRLVKARAGPVTGRLRCTPLRRLFVSVDSPDKMGMLLVDVPSHFPLIESLTVHSQTTLRFGSMVLVDLERCLQLRHLDLHLAIPLAWLIRLPTSIVSLALRTSPNPSRPNFFTHSPSQEVFNWFLPRLEELELDIPAMLIDEVAYALFNRRSDTELNESTEESPSTLQALTIKSAAADPGSMDSLLTHPRLADLETLRLPSLQGCTDLSVSEVADSRPKIRVLDLSETEVTGIAVKEIVKTGCLQELIVNDCRLLGSDAVDWARSQGVRVQYRMRDTMTGGKKVRY